jgi:hypothetical protein
LHEVRNCMSNNQNWSCVSAEGVQNNVSHECDWSHWTWSDEFPEPVSKALALDCNQPYHFSE